MNKLLKKAVSFVLAIAMISSIGCVAFANAEMRNMVFVGYDTTAGHYYSPEAVQVSPNRIYNEVINGVQTGKQILEPVEKEAIEILPEGYEGVYPYAGYSRMYIDGNAQPITAYNGFFPQWEEKRADYIWELRDPHFIYERHQTNVPGKGWTWDYENKAFGIPDSDLLTKTAKKAVVLDEGYQYYGFGPYDVNCENLTYEEEHMYQDFLVEIEKEKGKKEVKTLYDATVEAWRILTGKVGQVDAYGNPASYFPDQVENNAFLSVKRLSERHPVVTPDGKYITKYVISDEDIQKVIPVVRTKYVTAKFNENSDAGLATMTVADEYLKYVTVMYGDEENPVTQAASNEYINNVLSGWMWDVNEAFVVTYDADIDWTEPTFQNTDHKMYQYLIINGNVMDGRNGNERIVRYTDGTALPNVEWRFVFYQNKFDANGEIIPWEYTAVEYKYIDGELALDNNGDAIWRTPVAYPGENTYFVKADNSIETWKVDAEGKTSRLSKVDNWVGSLGGKLNEAAYVGGTLNITNTIVPSEVNKMIP